MYLLQKVRILPINYKLSYQLFNQIQHYLLPINEQQFSTLFEIKENNNFLCEKMSDKLKPRFLEIYKELKSELLDDKAFEFTDGALKWVDKMLDYNVLGGKLNRGLSVIDSYIFLKEQKELTSAEIFETSALGWCIEWLQAYFLVLDDIMDGSHTRRGQECWFRLPEVGLIAINDGILLRNHIPRILKKHFKGKPYYVDLLELFNEVEFQTASGQMIDLITTHAGKNDLSKYSLTVHKQIVQYKTAYYSFYLPVACALLMAGENLDNHTNVKDILIDMGIYFQVQDDYLDCFGDPKVLGKIGTDIQDFKCSWLVMKALEHCNEEQKKILHENYGKSDDACAAKVKALYDDLKLKDVYKEYENNTHAKLINSIEAQPSQAVQAVLKSFLAKIYMRDK
ncbi:Farnesyl pyrophosphate synthase 1 [Capsicum chinense]|uniref:Farnesyl pyrophosphate synthase 1 n=1 Tax=Capsicum annuum TaxID=4072 RepID=A0A1U8EE36_CAPAN|nr:farnesyl pyrophosphate synthase [Capsicum annuum]KAF3616179.1 Farnesyl pyrophosphate synthase 1 [Capsicum annuum]KAF3649059.1 Farnesyl pyrophosphate synthase 1 [Capsicum annuum]PHT69538.1 Farnesyl pyrophosphate synthase 1 [Capsicum annuum]PHU04088.1 Farnesyl pyrophosphate synthase 1 [Capsicum chinense]